MHQIIFPLYGLVYKDGQLNWDEGSILKFDIGFVNVGLVIMHVVL